MSTPLQLAELGHPVEGHRPWPRSVVDAIAWRSAIQALEDQTCVLLGLWGEQDFVHMAVIGGDFAAPAVLSLAARQGRFPSVGARHAPAIRLERTICDLYGLEAEDALDRRPWLDHGRWPDSHPLGAATSAPPPEPYPFLPSEGEGLCQIPVGPVHAGIIEPGHFRFTTSGETIVRLEERLGYLHRGVESRMAGASLDRAAALAGRACGDSTVAYQIALARAAEAALDLEAPPRAHWLRAMMAELERLANHLGDIGAVCNDAAFALMHAHCGRLRESVLRACGAAFGHRLMMDCVVPGGVAVDLAPAGETAVHAAVATIRERFPTLVALYDDTASLQDRTVGTGVVAADLVRRFGAGGFVGRASGRAFDARRCVPYPPYDEFAFGIPLREAGDVDARVWIRIDEVGQSLALLDQLLAGLSPGPLRIEPPAGSGEGVALVEGFRGDIFTWLRIEAGAVARCCLRDPSWFQWPLLEAAIEGNIVADFPLCNKSFNCAYAGVDL